MQGRWEAFEMSLMEMKAKFSSSQLVKFTTQCLALIKYYKGLTKNPNILKKQLYADVALSMAHITQRTVQKGY